MFETILNNGMESGIFAVLICMAVALVLGLLVAFVYMKTDVYYTKNMAVTMVLLPPIVTGLISVVNGNLGTGIAILGVFALVRFRSKPGSAKDILYVLFSMTIGVTAASGYIFYTVLLAIVVSAVLLLLTVLKFGERSDRMKRLHITMPENMDYETAFDEVFEKYLTKWSLEKVKTANLGSIFELQYEVELKSGIHEKELLDEIRIRNGNLTVMMTKCKVQVEEL